MRILAIDFSHLFRRMYEACASDGVNKSLSEANRRTLQTVAGLRVDYDRVAILCDGGPSFRRAIDPAYKSKREKLDAPFYEQQNRTIERLQAEACLVFMPPEIDMSPYGGPSSGLFAEADDLCASLAKWCMDHEFQIDVYGGDKDLLQLVNETWRVRVMHPTTGPIDRAAVVAKFGIDPALIADMLALAGDDSDNYKPFPKWTDADGDHPGIGAKTAIELIKVFGSASSVIDALDAKDLEDNAITVGKAHTDKCLRRGLPSPREAMARGMNLATLRCDLPVDFSAMLSKPVYAQLVQASVVAEPDYVEDRVATLPSEPTSAMVPLPAEETSSIVAPTTPGLLRFSAQHAKMNAMVEVAERFYDARFFSTFPNANAIFAVMWLAAERGENVGHALVNSYVTKIGNAPGYLATYHAARVKASPVCKVFKIIETTATYAVVQYQRVDDDEPGTYRFDIQEALDAGWDRGSKDSPWRTRPRSMCRAAALREAAKAFFFDVVSGMGDADEFVNGG